MFGGSGSLDAFRVTGGEINIGTAGLNASNTDQLDLISRSVKVNGELWGNNLNVITGANQVNYANLGVQIIAGDANKPTVGIDVAQLGGMYANKIRLVGTEAGVGVVSAGTLASTSAILPSTAPGASHYRAERRRPAASTSSRGRRSTMAAACTASRTSPWRAAARSATAAAWSRSARSTSSPPASTVAEPWRPVSIPRAPPSPARRCVSRRSAACAPSAAIVPAATWP